MCHGSILSRVKNCSNFRTSGEAFETMQEEILHCRDAYERVGIAPAVVRNPGWSSKTVAHFLIAQEK